MCTELSSAGAHETIWLPQGTVIPPFPTNIICSLQNVTRKNYLLPYLQGLMGKALKNANIQEVPAAQHSHVIQFFLHNTSAGSVKCEHCEKAATPRE